jgi:uncharacterized protein YdgA (DUF945 family)
MKKWLGGIIVLLLLIGLITPGLMGIVAQKRLTSLAANLPANSPFTLKVISYDKGWFSSNVQLDVTLNNAKYNPPIHFQVNEVVKHGPFIISFKPFYVNIAQAYAHGEVIVPEDQQALFKQYVDQTTLVNDCITLHLFGGISLKLMAPELTVSSPTDKNVKITLENLASTATLSGNMKKVVTHTVLQSLLWQDTNTVVTVTNVASGSALRVSPQGLWLGQMRGSLESINVQADSKPSFTLKNLQYNSNSKESKGLISMLSNLTVDNVTIKDASYGPGQLTFSFKNVNAAPLARLKKFSRMISQAQPGSVNMDMASQHTEKLVLRTVARGLQFSVDPISLQTPNGQLTGQIDISLPNLLEDQKGQPLKHPRLTIPALIGNMNGSVQFSVPKAIVQNSLSQSIEANLQSVSQAANAPATQQQITAAASQRATVQLQGWVAAGFLADNGTNYQFSAAYQQGQLLINGKPLFSGAFTGGAPGQGIDITVPMPLPTATPAPAVNSTLPVPAAPIPPAPTAADNGPAPAPTATVPADNGSAPAAPAPASN